MVYPQNRTFLSPNDFPNYEGKSITFCITNECDLRCTYCYIHNKNSEMEMTFETAKEIIDTMYANPHLYFDDPLDEGNKKLPKGSTDRKVMQKLIFDFIGGEPFIRVELIDQISEYLLYKNYKEGFKYNFMLSFSTNGVTYRTEKVQDYIKKFQGMMSIGITIDGTRQMHDACRVFPEGHGSYDIVEKSVEQWLKDFPGSGTKVTIAPENLPFLSEALIHLWENIGIQFVPANVVFEEVWTDEHPPVFERELNKIKDFLLTGDNYKKYTTTLFDETIGKPIPPDDLTPPCGGNGAMLHWIYNGNFYNCIRYAPTSCKDGKGFPLGSLKSGWNMENYKCLCSMDRRTSSDDECFDCEVASGCSYCPGAQYDYYGDPNKRAKGICEMHKSRVKISNAFFEEAAKLQPDNECISIPASQCSELDMDDLHSLSNKMAQIKNLLKFIQKYPDLDMVEIMEKYQELRGEFSDKMAGIINLHLDEKQRDIYTLDISRNCFILSEVYNAQVQKEAVLN